MSVNSIEPLIKAQLKDQDDSEPSQSSIGAIRDITCKRGVGGYGMYLREVLPESKLSSFIPSETKPSTQLCIDVDEGGMAQKAGLQAGDFILEINDQDVRKMPHKSLLDVIASSNGEIVLKVCYVPKFKVLAMEAKQLKTKNKEQHSSISPSSRRRRIKVLPQSDQDVLNPDQISSVEAGVDPNKAENKEKVPEPVRILPGDCDPATIWEEAKKMDDRRKSKGVSSEDNAYLPETKPETEDPQASLEKCRDHPYKWDVHQTADWLLSVGLGHIAAKFTENVVRGEHLKFISKDDLRSIDIDSEDDLKAILEAIDNLLQRYVTADGNSGGGKI